MKKLLILSFGILLIASCKKPNYDNPHMDDNDDPKGGSKKIDVCHREGNGGSHIINISKNAWPAHQAHGDVRLDDQDGDGFVPNNDCAFGHMGDCDDSNAAIHPGAVEICGNNIDENCNGQLNESCVPTNLPIFDTVKICAQVWMSKNLNVRFYRNGDIIPQVTDNNAWATLTTGAWCWYNNDSATYAATYGRLYNWYAVVDPRGLAPTGWHIPSAEEWAKLAICLGGESTAGGTMKEAGTMHWITPNTGANNSSGFAGLPAGMTNGQFANIGMHAYWWSSTQVSQSDAMYNYLKYNNVENRNASAPKTVGLSVRCVKN